MSKKYRVIRDCHWNYGYRDKGTIVVVHDNDPTPPEHFEPIDGPEPETEKAEVQAPETFTGIQQKSKETAPKTGMAATKKGKQ